MRNIQVQKYFGNTSNFVSEDLEDYVQLKKIR